MKNLIKTGITVSAIAVLSLVGFTAAFGYGGSGGSGWIDPRCYTPVRPHDGGFRVGRGGNTTSHNVTLDLDGGDAEFMMVSDKADFAGANIEPYSSTKPWDLGSNEGSKMVYVRFFNHCRIPTNIFTANFNFRRFFGRVLGAQTYADGTLLRGSDNRIYVVKGNTLVYIPSLAELLKHVGKEILKVDDSVIADFATLNAPQQAVLGAQTYANGALLRGSDKKIYVIVGGKKVYIRSLEELAKKHLGKAIFDVTDEVLAQY